MDDTALLAFETHRPHLRAVAYRMLGSLTEADDALQEAWLRVSRAGIDGVDNVGGWLTTIVARICLNMLQARRVRSAGSLGLHLPDPVLTAPASVTSAAGRAISEAAPGTSDPAPGPEEEALLADAVGIALDVVLDTLTPAERLAFVLHDLFGLPFDEIAPMLARTPATTRQLASRARRRVRGAAPAPDADIGRQREAVNAFFAAARRGDFDALIAVLDPDVVFRGDGGPSRPEVSAAVQGAEAVANQALRFAQPRATLHPALINGAAGVVVEVDGAPFSIMAFTVVGGRIVAINALVDVERIKRLEGLDAVMGRAGG
jgi:RNA polymerase sigma factor (sigma-70 family)